MPDVTITLPENVQIADVLDYLQTISQKKQVLKAHLRGNFWETHNKVIEAVVSSTIPEEAREPYIKLLKPSETANPVIRIPSA